MAEGSSITRFGDSIEAQVFQRYSSEILWHFVGREKNDEISYKTLLSVLRTGLKVGDSGTEFIFYTRKENNTFETTTLNGYPASCLADIPLKDLPLHAQRYGQYAIGFHRSSAVNLGFNPVLYVNQGSMEFRDFIRNLEEIGDVLRQCDKLLEKKFEHVRMLLGFVAKSGFLRIAPHPVRTLEEEQLQNFYYEREWRSPRNWSFKPEDVAAVIVPDARVSVFLDERNRGDLQLARESLLIPFTMIYRF